MDTHLLLLVYSTGYGYGGYPGGYSYGGGYPGYGTCFQLRAGFDRQDNCSLSLLFILQDTPTEATLATHMVEDPPDILLEEATLATVRSWNCLIWRLSRLLSCRMLTCFCFCCAGYSYGGYYPGYSYGYGGGYGYGGVGGGYIIYPPAPVPPPIPAPIPPPVVPAPINCGKMYGGKMSRVPGCEGLGKMYGSRKN